MIVDAHVHLWDARHTPQPWMTSEHAAIARPFGPDDLRPLLARNGSTRSSSCREPASTRTRTTCFAEAARHDWIAAVTAWLALDDPGADASEARRARERTRLPCGPTSHPQRGRPALDPAAARARDISRCSRSATSILELPVVFPRHLDDVPVLAERFPRLADRHRPSRQAADRNATTWRAGSAIFARRPRLRTCLRSCRASTRRIDRSDWSVDDLLPACQIALDSFGPESTDVRKRLARRATERRLRPRLGRDAATRRGDRRTRTRTLSSARMPHASIASRTLRHRRIAQAGEDAWQHR